MLFEIKVNKKRKEKEVQEQLHRNQGPNIKTTTTKTIKCKK